MTFFVGVALSLAGIYWLVRGIRRARRQQMVRSFPEQEVARYRWKPSPGTADRMWSDWLDRLEGKRRRRRDTLSTELGEIGAEVHEATQALLMSIEEELRAELIEPAAAGRPGWSACRDARLRAAGRIDRTRRRPRVAARLRGLAS
jgi:hypothetical protein